MAFPHYLPNSTKPSKHTNSTSSPPKASPKEWTHNIALIAKDSYKQAKIIATKYTRENIKKVISKYRQIYKTSPKKINKRVFKSNDESPALGCITYQINILISPKDIKILGCLVAHIERY